MLLKVVLLVKSRKIFKRSRIRLFGLLKFAIKLQNKQHIQHTGVILHIVSQVKKAVLS